MLSVLFGLVGIIVGVLWLVSWGAWSPFLVVLQGSLPPFLILVGLVALAAGISSMKDKAAAKKEEEKFEEEGLSDESSDDDLSEEKAEEKGEEDSEEKPSL